MAAADVCREVEAEWQLRHGSMGDEQIRRIGESYLQTEPVVVGNAMVRTQRDTFRYHTDIPRTAVQIWHGCQFLFLPA